MIFVVDYVHDQCKTQNMCDRVVSEDRFWEFIALINI